MNKGNEALPRLSNIMYVVMRVLLAAAAICAVLITLSGPTYRETLRLRGIILMIGGVAFAAAYFTCWGVRRSAINRQLIEVYGVECCKPVRRPALRQDDAAEPKAEEKAEKRRNTHEEKKGKHTEQGRT